MADAPQERVGESIAKKEPTHASKLEIILGNINRVRPKVLESGRGRAPMTREEYNRLKQQVTETEKQLTLALASVVDTEERRKTEVLLKHLKTLLQDIDDAFRRSGRAEKENGEQQLRFQRLTQDFSDDFSRAPEEIKKGFQAFKIALDELGHRRRIPNKEEARSLASILSRAVGRFEPPNLYRIYSQWRGTDQVNNLRNFLLNISE